MVYLQFLEKFQLHGKYSVSICSVNICWINEKRKGKRMEGKGRMKGGKKKEEGREEGGERMQTKEGRNRQQKK